MKEYVYSVNRRRQYSWTFILGLVQTYVNQLPPVAMKSVANYSNPNSSCSSDAIGKIAFSKFMDPPNELETFNFTFLMTDAVRQKDEQFKNILSLTRNWTLTNEKCIFLINHFLSKVNKKNKYVFNEAIHLVTQWKHSIDPTIKYLNMLRPPVANIIPQYSTFMTSKGATHCLKECDFSKLTVLNVGCKY